MLTVRGKKARSASAPTVKIEELSTTKGARGRRPDVIVVTPNPSRQSRTRARGKRVAPSRRKAPPALDSYIKCLTNPWAYGPIRMGWGCGVSSSLRTAFYRASFNPNDLLAASTDMAIAFYPLNVLAGTTPGTNPGFINYYNSTASTTLLSASTKASSAAINNVALAAQATRARIVGASLRVTVRNLASNLRGTVTGTFLPDTNLTELQTLGYDTAQAVSAARFANSDSPGQTAVEVQYRPNEPTSFDFTLWDLATYSANTNAPIHLVVLKGFPAAAASATWKVDIEAIAHYETLGTVDLSGADFTPSDSLALSGVTSDIAAYEASHHLPVLTDMNIIETLDHALLNVRNSGARTGMGSSRILGKIAGALNPLGNPEYALPGVVVQPSYAGGGYVQVDRTPNYPIR